jgi:hypothetical protein
VVPRTDQQLPLSSTNTSPADKPDDSVIPRSPLTQQDSTLYFVRPAGLGVGVGVGVLVGVGVGVLVGVGVGVGVAAGQKVLSSHFEAFAFNMVSTLLILAHKTLFNLVTVPILYQFYPIL